jgi:hypothetical protein
LLEITSPSDSRSLPLDQAGVSPYRQMIDDLKTSASSQKVVLTDLLRVASADIGGIAGRRGAVRFEQELRPSAAAWSQYKAGTLTWNSLVWPQGLGGSKSGLRQAWLRMELQLMPGDESYAQDPNGSLAVPFFGSAALYYTLPK